MLTRIHHVGVVVPSLEEGLKFWRDTLGMRLTKSATIEEQGVRAALLEVGGSEIELLEPLSPEGGVGKFLARRGGGLHHVCFETDDVEARARRRQGQGNPANRSDAAPWPGRDDLLSPSQGDARRAGRVRAAVRGRVSRSE